VTLIGTVDKTDDRRRRRIVGASEPSANELRRNKMLTIIDDSPLANEMNT